MTIKAVTFDLWNTLVYNRNYGEFRLPELDRVLRSNNIKLSEGELRKVYMSGFTYSSKVIQTEGYRHVETIEIIDKVLESVGFTTPEVQLELVKIYEEAVLCDPPKLKEGVFEALDYVKDRYKIGMISVTGVSPGKIMRKILKDHGVLGYFDVLTFSDEVKYVKPHSRLFKACLTELNVAPEASVHVGDSFKSDIVGAIDTGMKAIWVKTREQDQKRGYVPDIVISGLEEFPAAFRALTG